MAPLLDPRLRREPLAERTHVTVPQRLALERAEERVPAGQPEPLSAVEPAVDGLGGVAGQRGCAGSVALSVEDAERAAGEVEVFREERERLRDAEPRAEEHGQQSAVADAGWRAPRAGSAKRLDVG